MNDFAIHLRVLLHEPEGEEQTHQPSKLIQTIERSSQVHGAFQFMVRLRHILRSGGERAAAYSPYSTKNRGTSLLRDATKQRQNGSSCHEPRSTDRGTSRGCVNREDRGKKATLRLQIHCGTSRGCRRVQASSSRSRSPVLSLS